MATTTSTGPDPVAWHALAVDEVAQRFEVDPCAGLDEQQVRERLREHGENRIEVADETPWWFTLASQFRSPLIYVLMAAGVLTALLGHWIDAGFIAGVLALNASIGYHQERRAERSVRALHQLVSPEAQVVRDGGQATIASTGLVPGDVVLLESGARVPADLRLLRVQGLRVDESLLTGESVPVEAHSAPTPADAPLGDRLGMAYGGSTIVTGRARGVVVATGDATELGRIAEHVRAATRVESPLQERMRRFAHLIGFGIVLATTLTFLAGLALGHPAGEMLLVSAALAVAAIPEGLPVVLTVALALGVRRMAARHAIVRHLAAVETLGSTSWVGADKTGTLTENRMTVRELWAPDGAVETVGRARLAGVLANEARVDADAGDEADIVGDPTEVALLRDAIDHGIDVLGCDQEWEDVAEIPFESERRYAASFRRRDGEAAVFVKGAPERILEMCDDVAGGEAAVRERVEQLAARGLRVLATAWAPLDAVPSDVESPDEPAGLQLLALHGLMDPPREGVREAIRGCRSAGQRVVMITGDHVATARAIAQELGILDEGARVVEGRDLDELDEVQLQELAADVAVVARASPEHKLRVVQAARAAGHVVAVTGDGVNDAPALKAADIGVAMGRGGTDVARDASDIVLTDDNFVSIHDAVEEGRVTFDNVRKVTFFLVSTGLGTLLIVPASIFLGWPLVLVPAQLLWANLVTKGLQDLALAFERGEPDVLEHPPRPRGAPVITGALWMRTAMVGLVMAIGTLLVYRWALAQPELSIDQQRAIALTTLVVFQAFHLGSCRSELRSVMQVPLLSNRFLVIAQVAALAVHVAALYLPPTQFVLRVEPFPLQAWALLVAVASSVLVVVEVEKLVRRRVEVRARAV
jgi:calcium-translocating P-type ATPase